MKTLKLTKSQALETYLSICDSEEDYSRLLKSRHTLNSKGEVDKRRKLDKSTEFGRDELTNLQALKRKRLLMKKLEVILEN